MKNTRGGYTDRDNSDALRVARSAADLQINRTELERSAHKWYLSCPVPVEIWKLLRYSNVTHVNIHT